MTTNQDYDSYTRFGRRSSALESSTHVSRVTFSVPRNHEVTIDGDHKKQEPHRIHTVMASCLAVTAITAVVLGVSFLGAAQWRSRQHQRFLRTSEAAVPASGDRALEVNSKCGGAVYDDNGLACQDMLWNPTGDSNMHCYAYGGEHDPCSLNINNDKVNYGMNKDPSQCMGDTFYLWDEPDTQHKSYSWAGTSWNTYSSDHANQLRELRARGTKVTTPLIKAGAAGTLEAELTKFFNACGDACSDPSDPAYIDVIAVNAFCGPWNHGDCGAGASFIYGEAKKASQAFGNRPVYITNWSYLGSDNPYDQLLAMDGVDDFFPSSDGIIERVYWFGAKDYGGGTKNNLLTDTLSNGKTLGQAWKDTCGAL